MKIMVAVPTHVHHPATFTASLSHMIAFSVSRFPEGTEFGFVFSIGTYVHSARNELLKEALKNDVDYILWLDSDMVFPPDTLMRLISHRVPGLVGANYSTKDFPGRFVAIKEVTKPGAPGKMCATTEDSEGLEEVEAIGFGVCLLDMKAVRDWVDGEDPDARPFFFEWVEGMGTQYGEDVVFCNSLRAHGGRIFVDHDLSKVVKHTGNYEYTTDHAALSEEMKDVADHEL